MGFSDIFKSSFLEGFTSSEIGISEMVIFFLITLAIGTYIFFCYRLMTRKAFYSKEFAISLVAVALVTAAIIIAIQSSIVISLGMVGALSIVRFRTAVKEPMDLAFLFWAISIGIICGAGRVDVAVILSIFMTIGIFVLDCVPIAKATKILVVKMDRSTEANTTLEEVLHRYCRSYKEKSRSVYDTQSDVVFELYGGVLMA